MKSTEDGRGNGAFAAADIPEGAHIGIYEGELLDEAAYWERYPSGVVPPCTPQTTLAVHKTAVVMLVLQGLLIQDIIWYQQYVRLLQVL